MGKTRLRKINAWRASIGADVDGRVYKGKDKRAQQRRLIATANNRYEQSTD